MDSFDSRAEAALVHNDRRIWNVVGANRLDFLPSVSMDEALLSPFFMSPHPNYVAQNLDHDDMMMMDPPGPIEDLDSGLFISHPGSKSIWWLSDSQSTSAHLIISANCSNGANQNAEIECTNHPLRSPGPMAVTPSVSNQTL